MPGTFRELESLSEVFGNVSRFTAGDAVKSNFIEHAGDHDEPDAQHDDGEHDFGERIGAAA